MWAFMTSWLTPTSLFVFLNLVIGTIAITSRYGSTHRKQEHHHGPDGSPPQLARAPSLIDRVKSINFSLYKFNEPETHTETIFPHHSQHENALQVEPTQLARTSSLLDRLKPTNFSLFKFPEPATETSFLQNPEPEYTHQVEQPQLARAPSLLERVKSNLSSLYRSDSQITAEPEPDPTHTQDSTPFQSSGDHLVRRIKSETKASTGKKAEKMKKSASEKMTDPNGEEEEKEMVEKRRPATSRIEKTNSFGDDGVDAKADDFINRFKQQLRLQRLDSLLRYKEMLKGNKN